MKLFKILFLLKCTNSYFLPQSYQSDHQRHLMKEEESITVKSGDMAEISCDTAAATESEKMYTNCHWFKDDIKLLHSGRYSISDNCDLRISPVMPLDEGSYQCQVGGGGGQVMLSSSGELRVDTEPGTPHILDSEAGVILDHGDILQLVCQSSGARPAASIDWWDGETGEQIISQVNF